jgi:hypothetical protein
LGFGCKEKGAKRKKKKKMRYAPKVGHRSQLNFNMLIYVSTPSTFSSAPPANGFSQMARMMDSLILDSLSTTPYAYTKITTHRPMKKATSTNHLPTNGMSSSTTAATRINKKIPTQGNRKCPLPNHHHPSS